jgi:hypothetical protein
MATEKTRHLVEFVCLQKDQRRAPADNFLELKNNVATFMSLIWVLFGSNCNYYKGLRLIYATMDLREVMAIKALFLAEHCRRITWAIIDNGRSYFDNAKSTLDFVNGASIVFPQSFLVDIIKNVRYSTPVKRGNFPQEWLTQRKTPRQEPGQTNARTQGSGTSEQGRNKQAGQQYRGQGNYQGTGTLGGGYNGGYNYQPRD